MRKWLQEHWEEVRASYWFIPTIMAVAAIALALAVVRLDRSLSDNALDDRTWIYSGGPEGARAVLSTIAGSIITVAGTTFSITIAALSLASAQFGPRLLRNFMRDTANQVVLGTFTSTFLYCLLVLRTVRGLEGNTYVPHISVTLGVALAVTSLGVLIFFIHHIAESIQVGRVIAIVSAELHEAVTRVFPDHLAEEASGETPPPPLKHEVCAELEGYVQGIQEDELLKISKSEDAVFRLLARPGDFIVTGSALLLSSRDLSDKCTRELRDVFTIGRSRTPYQDASFAFQQLADVALRALSPSLNDPFTAITCIDRITSAMAHLATRSLPSPVRMDDTGKVRIFARSYTYDDLVTAAFSHIREAARDHWQVLNRLRTQLEFLMERSDNPELNAALRRELAALRPPQ